MSSKEGRTKVAAACTSCGSVYAAEKWPDGSILPIGRRDGCRCGCASFDAVGSDDDDALNPVS